MRRDPYVWIDPWAEFDSFDDFMKREREEHHNAMRRAYGAMADENAAYRERYATLVAKVTEGASMYMTAPPMFVVPK